MVREEVMKQKSAIELKVMKCPEKEKRHEEESR